MYVVFLIICIIGAITSRKKCKRAKLNYKKSKRELKLNENDMAALKDEFEEYINECRADFFMCFAFSIILSFLVGISINKLYYVTEIIPKQIEMYQLENDEIKEEMKANGSTQQMLNTYNSNSEKIKALRHEALDASIYKLWLWFDVNG